MTYRSLAGGICGGLLLIAGCANDVDSDVNFSSTAAATNGDPTDGASTGGMADGGDSNPGDASAGGTGGADGGSGGEDSGGEESTGEPVVDGMPCGGVDLVFVVDNTETMAEEQNRLISVASTFVSNLNGAIPSAAAGGFHIGVLTTDDADFKTTDRDNSPCGEFATGPWMSPGPDFPQTLACTLNQGVGGDPDGRPMDSLLGALVNAGSASGGGEGFLRDDALLVVVLVTDQDDAADPVEGGGSMGDPSEWAQSLADIKGFKQNVVVFSMVGHPAPNACPPFQWDGNTGAEIATRLLDFTERFPNNIVGDVCALQYSSQFNAAVDPIADACGNLAQ